MNLRQALKCLVDETANEEKLAEARSIVRQFLEKCDHIEDLATDPDRQSVDTYPLLTDVLADEGLCLMVFCNAVDVRESLTQKGIGDLARKLPNAQVIQRVIDTVRAKGGKLPTAFEAWRTGIISDAARSFVQDLLNAWPEAPGSRVRIIRKKQDHSHEPEGRADTPS